MLSDLSSWPTLQSELKEFLDEMTDNQREQFDNWCRDNLHEIEAGNLSLKTSSQVVYFEAGKDMKVSAGYCVVEVEDTPREPEIMGSNPAVQQCNEECKII